MNRSFISPGITTAAKYLALGVTSLAVLGIIKDDFRLVSAALTPNATYHAENDATSDLTFYSEEAKNEFCSVESVELQTWRFLPASKLTLTLDNRLRGCTENPDPEWIFFAKRSIGRPYYLTDLLFEPRNTALHYRGDPGYLNHFGESAFDEGEMIMFFSQQTDPNTAYGVPASEIN